jgi:lipopolysaccharide/colanic/teichoic acid biosynthesis glycosyltransferase
MHILPAITAAATLRKPATRTRRSDGQVNRTGEFVIRAIDIVVASLVLIALAPVMLLVAIVIWLSDQGPVLDPQPRFGRHGRSFRCLKFRTMVVDADRRLGQLLATDADAREEWSRDLRLSRDPRITPLGDFLRQSGLDELPQLINVLRGEMSIVGPRPITEREIGRYGRYFSHYGRVKPGLTGLWLISIGSNPSYRRRIALDIAYARKKSVRLDLQILAMTIPALLLG